MKTSLEASRALARLCCEVLAGKKADDLVVLDVAAQSSITNYLVVATGTSETHLRALRVELEKVLDQAQVRLVGMETGTESGWIVIDAFDVMVHLFTRERREQYGLEHLWKDAAAIPIPQLLGQEKPAPAPKRRTPARKKPAAAKAKKPAAKKNTPKSS